MFVVDGLAERLQEPDRVVQEAAVHDRVADAGEDLLLARGAGEVALAGGLANPRVGERLLAVEVMPPGRDREPRLNPYSS